MELKHILAAYLAEVRHLLIVPYGIETEQDVQGVQAGISFNCTLWN